ncbi:MAG: protein translocase subunit SecF [Candidatus Paceibacterota bacterium]
MKIENFGIKIIEQKKLFILIGVVLMVASLGIIFGLGIRPSIDFTGGSLMEVSYDNRPAKEVIESSLNGFELGGYSLRQSVDESGRGSYQLRTRDLSEEERSAIESVMVGEEVSGEITRFTSIGPVIGDELQEKSKWAIGAVALIIVIYIGFAFLGVRWPVGSSVYGGITILSLAHDVLVPAAMMAILGYFFGIEADVLFVMALLAVLGYSVNDTIVVFDRVRENIVKYRNEHKRTVSGPGGLTNEEVTYSFNKPFSEIVGLSVSETLLRSINTSLTTALVLLALYFFGGEVTKTFALVLLAGVIAGAYSSIFFASPLLVWYAEWREGRNKAKA